MKFVLLLLFSGWCAVENEFEGQKCINSLIWEEAIVSSALDSSGSALIINILSV